MTDITWTSEKRRLGDLVEWEQNPRQLSKHDAEHLGRSIVKFNLADPLIINRDDGIIGGHQRKRVMLLNGYAADSMIDVRVPSRQLTPDEAIELNIRLNRNAGEFDWDALANNFDVPDMLDWGFTEFDLQMHDFEMGDEKNGVESGEAQDVTESYSILIECHDENEQAELLRRLSEEGLTCRALIS